jgi:histidinol-phosphate aminotransferase
MNPQIGNQDIDFSKFLRSHIRGMASYTPILPFEVLSKQSGIPIEEIIKLDANENPYGPLPAVREALKTLLYPHIYPDPESRDLRQVISARYEVPFQNILAGAGADELIDLIMRVLLNTGDAIIDCPPTFGMYAFDAAINHARVIEIKRRSNFSLDMQGILTAVSEFNPKILFLANPNNPDGSTVSSHDLELLLDLPMMIVIDEAYVDFALPETSILTNPAYKVSERGNLIVLRTFSKWAGLAGLRVGFGVFPRWLMPHLWKIKQPYNVSVAASKAALISLENADQLNANANQIISERDRLFEVLNQISWLIPYPSKANFILCKVIGRNAARLKADLAQDGILIRYFDKPGLQDHIRISIGLPEHTDRLIKTFKNWRD